MGIFWALLEFIQLHGTCSRKFRSYESLVAVVCVPCSLQFYIFMLHSLYWCCWTDMSEGVAVPRDGMLSH
jgi:hypothetical protein